MDCKNRWYVSVDKRTIPKYHDYVVINQGLSSHVETVCLLSKLNTKQHIEVEIKMDELDLTAAESKATYEEIKAMCWSIAVWKSVACISAQMKYKCGIIERENFNKPKSGYAKQPQCPVEKQAAIMEALKYFNII